MVVAYKWVTGVKCRGCSGFWDPLIGIFRGSQFTADNQGGKV